MVKLSINQIFWQGPKCSVNLNDRQGDIAYSSVGCCDLVQGRWSEQSSAFKSLQERHLFTIWFDSTVGEELTFTDGRCDGPFTTLSCETIARAMCPPGTSTIVVTSTKKERKSSRTRAGPVMSFPIPHPQCSINFSECESYMHRYYPALEAQNNALDNFGRGQGPWPNLTLFKAPGCYSKGLTPKFECKFGHKMQIVHWPIEVKEQELCERRPDTYSPFDPLGPEQNGTRRTSGKWRTVTWSGATFTEPTIYAFYHTMAHNKGLGGVYTNVAIELRPEDINLAYGWERVSYDYPWGWKYSIQALDMSDFGYVTAGNYSYPAVLAKSYANQLKCKPGWEFYGSSMATCGGPSLTIYQDWQPRMVFMMEKSRLAKIDPAWKYCGHGHHGAWDPPVVLSVIQTEATATSFPGESGLAPVTMPMKASPGSALGQTLATATNSRHGPKTIFTRPTAPPNWNREPELPQIWNESPRSSPKWDMESADRPPVDHPEAVFAADDRTFTATQLGLGTFEMQGTIFTVGGSAITVGPLIISALDSGIVVDGSVGTIEEKGPNTAISGTSPNGGQRGQSVKNAVKAMRWNRVLYLGMAIPLVFLFVL
jgi:hypothetical protein